jgi:DNA-binding XRE family transcriptional regulator
VAVKAPGEMSMLERRRRDKSMKQYDLAQAISVSPALIHNYETGKSMPSYAMAQIIAGALDATVEDLWETEYKLVTIGLKSE